MTGKLQRYPVVEQIKTKRNTIKRTLDPTSINIDKAVRELFSGYCDSYGISKYKTLNILLDCFMHDENFKELREHFHNNYFIEEQNLIKNLTENKIKKLTFSYKDLKDEEEEKEKLKKTKFVVPRTLYIDFCRVCRKNRKRVSYALVTALENYIEAKDKEFF